MRFDIPNAVPSPESVLTDISSTHLSFKRSFWLIFAAIAAMQAFEIGLAIYFGFDLQDSQIGLGVTAEHCGLIFPFVRQVHHDFGRVFDHMVISNDKTVLADDKSRAGTTARKALRRTLRGRRTKARRERGLGAKRITRATKTASAVRCFFYPYHADMDDGGRHMLGEIGKRG